MEQPVVLSKARLVFVIAIAGGLASCSSSSSSSLGEAMNPINWYRDIMGLSADDELGSGDNDQNLQEGSKEPYPNLASVPNPPDTALSSVDRDKLVDSLIADRNNAKYSNEDLVAGRTATTATAPAPPTKNTPTPSNTAAAAPPSPSVAPAAPPTPTQTASVPPVPPLPASPGLARPGQPPKRGSESPPAESPLTSPTVGSVPQGETATAAPPLPQMAPPPQQVAAAVPRATAPKLRPPGGASEAAAPATTPAPRGAAISYRAADIRFPPGSALLGDKLGDAIAEIVRLHNANGGTIRIVGHGEAGGANAAVAGLNLALDRAQAVAVALTNSGVPAQAISVEAAPVAARGGSDVPRAEVYLEN